MERSSLVSERRRFWLEIKNPPVSLAGMQGVWPIHSAAKEASVHEGSDFFKRQIGALGDNVGRYSVGQQIPDQFELAFFHASFYALFYSALFDLCRRVPQDQWYIHGFLLLVLLFQKFLVLPYKPFIFHVYNALCEEKQVALVLQAPSAFIEKPDRLAEKVEFLKLPFRPQREFRGIKNNVYRVFARSQLAVTQLRQNKIIILISYLGVIVIVRIIRGFAGGALAGNNSEGGWLSSIVSVDEAAVKIYPFGEASASSFSKLTT
jgi:hypothetical protein